MLTAFVSYGGWEGHQPSACAEWVGELLRRRGFSVDIRDTLEPLADDQFARDLSLLVPVWSLAEAPDAQLDALVAAVRNGVGLAAFHGAAATFQQHNGYRRLIGGSFVWHPDELEFGVDLASGGSFQVTTEQYHLHVDPSNNVIATTRLVDGTAMPIAWRRAEGEGRVFYSSLGHSPEILADRHVTRLLADGASWAANKRRQSRSSTRAHPCRSALRQPSAAENPLPSQRPNRDAN